jgi:predicted flap endonuclease-1-like 5' DNA nuclease
MSGWAWWLVLGLLLGWLVEWVIDWVYWRRRFRELLAQETARSDTELAALRQSLAASRADGGRLQAELDALNLTLRREQLASGELRSTSEALRAENDQLRQSEYAPLQAMTVGTQERWAAQLDAPRTDGGEAAQLLPEPRERQTVLPRAVEAQRDPLIDINGIGPVYERRLFEAGITTFDMLAALSPERVREIIRPEHWQEVHPEAWIEEARLLAARRSISS